jgi:hypothetical protein
VSRDIKLISHWRKLAGSTRLPAGRRLYFIDQLAAIDNIYHIDGCSEGTFVPTAAHALTIVKSLLNKLMRENRTRDRIRSRVIDRIAFMRGRDIKGFYRVADPLQAVTVTPVSTNPVADLLAKVEKFKNKEWRMKWNQQPLTKVS